MKKQISTKELRAVKRDLHYEITTIIEEWYDFSEEEKKEAYKFVKELAENELKNFFIKIFFGRI